MSEYIHHVQGRLRVKCPALKRNAAETIRVTAAMQSRVGIESCQVSDMTGSVLIRYDDALTNPDEIVERLRELGSLREPAPAARPVSSRWHRWEMSEAAKALAGAIANSMVERLVERSALRLISVIL